jgi:hypothetical protein
MSENKGGVTSLPGLNQADLVLLAACQIFSNAQNNTVSSLSQPVFQPRDLLAIQIDWDKVTTAINSQSVNSVKTRYSTAKKKARENGMEPSPELGTPSKTSSRKSNKKTADSSVMKTEYDADGEDGNGLTTANSDGATPTPSPAKKRRRASKPKTVTPENDKGSADAAVDDTPANPIPRKRGTKAKDDRTIPEKKKRGGKKASEKQTEAEAVGDGQQVDENDIKIEDAFLTGGYEDELDDIYL